MEAWNRVIVAGAASGSSGLTKEGFLTRWRVITLQDPRTAFEQVGKRALGCTRRALVPLQREKARQIPCVSQQGTEGDTGKERRQGERERVRGMEILKWGKERERGHE